MSHDRKSRSRERVGDASSLSAFARAAERTCAITVGTTNISAVTINGVHPGGRIDIQTGLVGSNLVDEIQQWEKDERELRSPTVQIGCSIEGGKAL